MTFQRLRKLSVFSGTLNLSARQHGFSYAFQSV